MPRWAHFAETDSHLGAVLHAAAAARTNFIVSLRLKPMRREIQRPAILRHRPHDLL